jgi:hypothetical protein
MTWHDVTWPTWHKTKRTGQDKAVQGQGKTRPGQNKDSNRCLSGWAPHLLCVWERKEEDDICCSQISRTEAESQWIVAQRPLSHVQYLVLYLSRIQRICLSWYLNLLFSIAWPAFSCRRQCRYNVMILNMPESMPIVIHENIKESRHIAASPAWILA